MAVLQDKANGDSVVRVINDRVLIQADEPEYSQSDKDVVDSLKSGRLVLPEEYDFAIKKYSGWGKIISWGDQCKYKWVRGMRVHFAIMASAKINIGDKEYRLVREHDVDLYEKK